MAYMCMKDYNRECDSCGDCILTEAFEADPETGVTITATIKLRFTDYGDIERALRERDTQLADEIAISQIDAMLDRCGEVQDCMEVEEYSCKLNE